MNPSCCKWVPECRNIEKCVEALIKSIPSFNQRAKSILCCKKKGEVISHDDVCAADSHLQRTEKKICNIFSNLADYVHNLILQISKPHD